MSQLLIQHYLNELQTLKSVAGTSRESVVSEAFKTLLKDWGRSRDLIFVPQYEYQTLQKKTVYPDGALLYALRVPFGYWEAKDTDDDLDEEIEKKFRRGYPQDNIIFEDSRQAVLIQNKQEVMRCGVEDVAQLQALLELFFGYERPEIEEFHKAIAQFKKDMPAVLSSLRDMIVNAELENAAFSKASLKFLKHAQETINPNVTPADVREMLIQHILTEEIFSQVFDNPDFHHKNNVARELYALENTFFTGKIKYDTLAGLRHYYAAIKSAAALVPTHHEKQNFLKLIYENFYKVYDKKKADRLGVIYTPNEIVRFMVESADWLCQKHFKKSLIDKDVEILDPACGTGTYITELIEHFRGQPQKLRYKYLEELHANEVAILPYYVANLNIEATYAGVNGYEEYPNLCFVDTLDNVAGLRTHAIGKGQHFGDLFGAVSEENVARIKRQNKKKISVIIGNPPYNANQLNENENNKNREYPEIDKRIKETYIKASAARKTKRYDMYSRFLRWASDRVDENGIVTFITNRNFLDAKEADGFRKIVVEEFAEIRIIDLGGDWKKKGRAGGGNVFGIGTGVAISFFVKRRTAVASGTEQILYLDSPVQPSEDKLAWLSSLRIADAIFEHIKPDKYGYWLNQPGAEFGNALALISSGTRATKTESQERAVCKLYSLGISTNRDEWLYDFDAKTLALKVREFISRYDLVRPDSDSYGDEIKWSRNLKRRLRRGLREPFNKSRTMRVMYRPYVTRWLYRSDLFIDESGQLDSMFPSSSGVNQTILISVGNRGIFSALAADIPVSLDMFVPNAVYQTPFVRYGQSGDRHLNVTEFTLKQTQDHYSRLPKASKRVISEGDLFHYAYGVLHDPIYREKYALNLKREFPHIPFYADFWKWAAWGEKLMALHIGYETVEPWPLERIDTPDEKSRKAGLAPKPMLIPRLGIDDSSCPALCRASTPSRGRFAGRNAALYQPLADGWR